MAGKYETIDAFVKDNKMTLHEAVRSLQNRLRTYSPEIDSLNPGILKDILEHYCDIAAGDKCSANVSYENCAECLCKRLDELLEEFKEVKNVIV